MIVRQRFANYTDEISRVNKFYPSVAGVTMVICLAFLRLFQGKN